MHPLTRSPLIKAYTLLIFSMLALSACADPSSTPQSTVMQNKDSSNLEIASFGAGCFWCVEAVFETLDGVHAVE